MLHRRIYQFILVYFAGLALLFAVKHGAGLSPAPWAPPIEPHVASPERHFRVTRKILLTAFNSVHRLPGTQHISIWGQLGPVLRREEGSHACDLVVLSRASPIAVAC